MLSIIIPTLNAAPTLAATLESLSLWEGEIDVIVVDGGSTDATVNIANDLGARVISTAQGRGPQLVEGARQAANNWMMFLHSDTVLSTDWPVAVQALVTGPATNAGYFRFRLDDGSSAASRLERQVAWRCRTLGWPYGDQGLVVHRDLYDSIGGYKSIPLMEDIDLIRRLGRNRIIALPADAITSAAKFHRDGYIWRSTRNITCLCLYLIGIPPHWLKRLYG